MKKLLVCVLVGLTCAAAALAAPRGLSGLSVGIGAGGVGDGYIQGEYDFTLSRYVCLGPELALGFGGVTGLYAGAAGRFYVIPDLHPIFQPDIAFGAGLAHAFDGGGDAPNPHGGDTGGGGSWTGAYIRFAFGCDFDIPRSPVSPYLDLGGIFLAGDGSDADFNVEAGIRISM